VSPLVTDLTIQPLTDQLSPHAWIRKVARLMLAGVLTNDDDITVKHEKGCPMVCGGFCSCNPTITKDGEIN